MTGITTTDKTVLATGDQLIDGVMSGVAWNNTLVTYAFPTTPSDYNYTEEPSNNFAAVSDQQKLTALFALEQSFGNAANDGFSVEGFTKLSLVQGSTTTSNIRFAQSDTPDTAYAYYPGSYDSAGDVWFGTAYAGQSTDYRNPVAGNYAWHTLIHELGHALGLKHGHETDSFGALPANFDSIEYSVMTYSGFVGDNGGGYGYEDFGGPQTFMMSDIAALQHMYGADFTTNGGNTVYKWTPGSGNTLVNGEVAIAPGDNRIFATIWDGGGRDTFDLSAYTTGMKIDLRPGQFSMFSADQLSFLGGGPNDGSARGNIFNALLFEGNLKSLIEDVKAGSGNDKVVGNQGTNALYGNNGDDTLLGLEGNDTLVGGNGADSLTGGKGADRLTGGSGADKFIFTSILDSTSSTSGRDIILDFLGSQGDRINLSAIDANTKVSGNQAFNFIGTSSFSNTASELRYVKMASDTYIYADVNGDGKSDFSIHLDDAVSLQKGFFVL